MTPPIFICVCRVGKNYDLTWSQRLFRQIEEQSRGRDFLFVCLTDDLKSKFDEGVRIPLCRPWPGWWSKLEMFTPGLFPEDRPMVYFDLDTLVTGDPWRLVHSVPNELVMCRDFLGGPEKSNSSAMAWRGDLSKIYWKFRADPDHWMDLHDKKRIGGRIGDQAFIEDACKDQGITLRHFTEGKVLSFKRQARNERPKRAVAVAFHGRPKPAEAGGWATRMWDEYGGHQG